MIACENSEISVKDCFTDVSKPIISGKGKEEFEKLFKEYFGNDFILKSKHFVV